MKLQPSKTERIHSLDSLRAIMMLLGIVFHSASPYRVTNDGLDKDLNAAHISIDILFFYIHSFRMPVFMLVAGFFGALLFYERGTKKMLKNRTSRILFPFIAFLFLLSPTIEIGGRYAKAAFAGSEHALQEATSQITDILALFIPAETWHLWFLYYLMMFTICSVLLALLFQKLPGISGKITQVFNWVFQKPFLRVFVFSGLTGLVFLVIGNSIVPVSFSFIPDMDVFLFYFSFYMVGWVLFKSKELLGSFKRLDWLCFILAHIFYALSLVLYDSNIIDNEVYQDITLLIVRALVIWFFVFGITGLFIRFASNHSARMRYVSDASYWVYLVHFTLTIFIAPMLLGWEVHGIIKFSTVVICTTVISFATYHYFVRGTFIGKFLNGRKYSRKISDIRKQEEMRNLKPALDK